jgi:hypothetical protein
VQPTPARPRWHGETRRVWETPREDGTSWLARFSDRRLRRPGSLGQLLGDDPRYRVQEPPAGFDSWDAALEAMGVPPERRKQASALVDPDGSGPRIFFQRVPEGKSAKNRVHLDVRVGQGLTGDERMAALEERCTRLVGLGATRIERHEPAPPMQEGHIVLADPEGNEFCLH